MGISDINIKAWFSPNQSVDKKSLIFFCHFLGFSISFQAPEQAIVVCNVYMIHNMKPLDVSSMLKPKKKIQKSKSPIWHVLDSNRANQPL